MTRIPFAVRACAVSIVAAVGIMSFAREAAYAQRQAEVIASIRIIADANKKLRRQGATDDAFDAMLKELESKYPYLDPVSQYVRISRENRAPSP